MSVIVPRASIRISLNGDTSSALRNRLRDEAFQPNGFTNAPGRHGTGTWTRLNCTEDEMSACMRSFWAAFERYRANGGKAKIDNFWAVFENIHLEQLAGTDEWETLKAELDQLGIGGPQ